MIFIISYKELTKKKKIAYRQWLQSYLRGVMISKYKYLYNNVFLMVGVNSFHTLLTKN